MIVEGRGDGIHYVVRHGDVNFTGQFDEARCEIIFARLPGKIEWIHGNAVSAESWARIERHEAEGLGGGSVDNFPDIHAHTQAEHLEFVDQCDVDAAKDIFQELGHFRSARGADRDHFCHYLRVESKRGTAAWRIDPADDFGNLRQAILLVSRIFSFG